jgi:hypothetical protein
VLVQIDEMKFRQGVTPLSASISDSAQLLLRDQKSQYIYTNSLFFMAAAWLSSHLLQSHSTNMEERHRAWPHFKVSFITRNEPQWSQDHTCLFLFLLFFLNLLVPASSNFSTYFCLHIVMIPSFHKVTYITKENFYEALEFHRNTSSFWMSLKTLVIENLWRFLPSWTSFY